MLPEEIVLVGVAINLFYSIWYIRTIFRGGTRPNLISWSIWTIAPFLGFFFMIRAGAGLAATPIFMAGFGSLLVIIFSIFKRNAFWKIQRFDLVCGLLSLVALIVYVTSQNLPVSIFFALASDLLAFIPTFVKTWKFPETESSTTYFGGIVNNFLALLIIKNWTFSIYAFPLYLMLANLAEVYLIYRKKIFKRHKVDSISA